GVLDHRRQLPRRDVLAALAVLGHLDRRIESGRLVEGGPDDAVDLHQEVEIAVRVFARSHAFSFACAPSWHATRLRALGDLRAAGPDANADDDELGGVARADADLDVEPAERLLREGVQHLVDADVVGLFRLRAEERAVAPGL